MAAETVRIDVDPFIRMMFMKDVVSACQTRTESDSYVAAGRTTIATYKYEAKPMNSWEFVQVFKELSAIEREVLRIHVPASTETSSDRGFGKRYFETSCKMTPVAPLDGHRMYTLEYTTSVCDRDEMGMPDETVETVYTVENIIGLGSPKAPVFYGITRAFVDWIRDRSIGPIERARRFGFARRIIDV